MKIKGASLPVIGNPVQWRRIEDPDDVDSVRRVDCRAYDRCLDLAERSGWRGFTCRQCTAYQAPTDAERQRQLTGCLELAEEFILPALAHEPMFVDESEDADDDGAGDGGAAADESGSAPARPCRGPFN
jgi:hypothetical protein